MTLSVFTNTQVISLEEGAADMFMNYILNPDESRQVQAVQTYEEKMMSKAINLPLTNGIDEVNKKMILGGLADLEVGDRFLCNGAKISDLDSAEAKYYLRLVANLNNGQNLTPEQAQVKTRVEDEEYTVMSKLRDEEIDEK
ncbi:hypothetical protein JHD50_05250 [Sulfurimonas sp. MAG313]|nr:hypothetical protein [Sulfurimonas sp. MAG313]MDF1880715.1 hypothetical protein [Sulfurimonas sp. MAG313]